MLIKDTYDDFINLFKKSFDNFCENTPFILSYWINGEEVHITDESPLLNKTVILHLDIHISVQENIHVIKKTLSTFFPVLFIQEEETIEQIKEKIKSGIIDSYEYAPQVVNVKRFILERINNKNNEVTVLNIKKNEKEIRKLKIPVVILLDKIYKSTPELGQYLIDNTIDVKLLGG